ncbi:rod shape-determining protein RodA [Amphibiibacter pelophylacis]|uniref:Rod shape-determining protein RodA n=1 Tax=Amphibiibacter pelophylacis TaxID=1799477 RepID=A0ACC6P5G4_9BURK
MSSALPSNRHWADRLRHTLIGFDFWLMLALIVLCTVGLTIMYSAGYDNGERFGQQSRNMVLGAILMLAIAQVPPARLMQCALPLYALGVLLLLLVMVPGLGISRKGALRWLNVGFTSIQPSELLKIAMPLMLAFWFHKREGAKTLFDYGIASALLLVPVALVLKQPDLGTALLILASGLYVMFFAGLSWKLIIPVILLAGVGITALILAGDDICKPGVDWVVLHDYQKNRVCTLLDPNNDPLGRGFHTLQGMIAIGSGGLHGKGFMQGTQTHLHFIPERTSDFIFAAFSEEFGFTGVMVLLVIYLCIVARCLYIAAVAPTLFSRLLGGALGLVFFTYAFVNMGMVSGILPVVGVPLPMVSYGGTAMVTLGMGMGMLMSISTSRRRFDS